MHRDLKPANLMIDEKGDLRILDFGIALAQERLVQTMVGRTKGSPPWMSPEQVQGEVQDGRSDLWVLSTIIFRLLTGEWWVKPPTGRDEGAAIFREILSTKWADRRSDFSAALGRGGFMPMRRSDRKRLEALMGSLLDHDKRKRPPSAAVVRATLMEMSTWDPEAGRKTLSRICRGILKGGPGAAPPVNVPTRRMPKVTQLTNPASAVPQPPTTEALRAVAISDEEVARETEAAREAALVRSLFENVAATSEFDLQIDVTNTDELPPDVAAAIDGFTARQAASRSQEERELAQPDPEESESAATESLPGDGIQVRDLEPPPEASTIPQEPEDPEPQTLAPHDLPEPEALRGFTNPRGKLPSGE